VSALNVAVVIDSLAPPQWIVSTLDELDLSERIQLNSIILQPTTVELPIKQPYVGRTDLSGIARKLTYGYVNRARFNTDPIENQTLPEHLRRLVSNQSQTQQQDVVLHLGNIHNDLSSLPKTTYGIWTVHHQNLTQRIEEALLIRRPMLWVHLWKLPTEQADSSVRIGSHSLPMQSFSISDALSYGFGSLPVFITSRLNWLANGRDPVAFEAEQIKPELFPRYAYPGKYQPPRMSSLSRFVRSMMLVCLQFKQRVRDHLMVSKWQLGFRMQTQHASESEISDFYELKPPAGTIWADPHLLIENNQTHVFFEELEFKENNGRIAWAVLTPDGFADKPKTVLAENHHLSYPFVFKHDDEIYMVPETAAQRSISLYKATRFPDKWEHVGNLLENINAADSTLFEHDGLWWLFTNGATHQSVDERDLLMLFYTDDLLTGDWQPHPLNPVITGIDRARMAGPIYQKDGELFRPSQFGATRYGFGINIAKIHTLSTTDYKESLENRLSPNLQDVWLGCHTAVHSDEFTVIDRLRRSWH